MSFIEALKESLKEDVVIKHQFLLEYKPRNRIVHLFFEGKTDQSFYCGFVRHFLPEGFELKTYICGNKDSVYFHYEKLENKSLPTQPLLFFVDKDIDDFFDQQRPVSEKIYVTDYYSIENYIVCRDSIEQIWSEIFRQPLGTDTSKKLAKDFASALNDAHKILLEIMAWVFVQRKSELRPNLDCIITKEYFEIDETLSLKRKLEIKEMIKLLDDQTKSVSSDDVLADVQNCLSQLEKHDPKKVIRGHNEMDFFIEFIKKLRTILNSQTGNKIKANVEITGANIVDLMGPRASIPNSLRGFLQQAFNPAGTLI